jgi:signal transduction histidine kinase
LMVNTYANPFRAPTIDVILNNTKKYQYREATASSDFATLSTGLPGIFIMHPVFSKDDKGNNITSGILAAGFSWDSILKQAVPLSAKGLKATITSHEDDDDAETIVYKFERGQPTYQRFLTHVEGTPFVSIHVPFRHFSFVISLYSTSEFERHYLSNAPTTATVIVISIALLNSIIFMLYDFTMNRQKREKEIIAETKRLFVRYISHEIRTPLNTVHLGLQVLEEEMDDLVDNIDKFHSTEPLKECLKEWKKFISSIDDSTEDAITVVSDLIDFDKLSTGMLNIERGIHDIWALIADTSKPFTVQARSKNISFTTNIAPSLKYANHGGGSSGSIMALGAKTCHLFVFGDSVKLQQVLRNLISNALKFTPEGGQVNVSSKHFKYCSASLCF